MRRTKWKNDYYNQTITKLFVRSCKQIASRDLLAYKGDLEKLRSKVYKRYKETGKYSITFERMKNILRQEYYKVDEFEAEIMDIQAEITFFTKTFESLTGKIMMVNGRLDEIKVDRIKLGGLSGLFTAFAIHELFDVIEKLRDLLEFNDDQTKIEI